MLSSLWCRDPKLLYHGIYDAATARSSGVAEDDLTMVMIYRKAEEIQCFQENRMEFIKMHGLGNDFIVVDNRSGKLNGTSLFELSKNLCNRNFGIGADGLVLVEASIACDLKMRIFNSDGSEAEMCGNAVRCIGKLAFESGWLSMREFSLETAGGGVKHLALTVNGAKVESVRVDMGKVTFRSDLIPVAGGSRDVVEEKVVVGNETHTFTAVNLGNPHCVIYVESVEDKPWRHWGPLIEKNPLFPAGINVEFVEIIGRDHIKVRVWERGAGPTLACGTGACASVAAGIVTGRLENDVSVDLPGGTLQISWDGKNSIFMQGPATKVFTGILYKSGLRGCFINMVAVSFGIVLLQHG